MNRKAKVIGIVVIIVLILSLIFIASKQRRVGKLLAEDQHFTMQQLEKGVNYHIYKYDYKTQEGSMLVQIADSENGIDTVTCPDGTIVKCYGKKQVGIDYPIKNDQTYSFIATTNTAETIQQDIVINQESIQNLMTFNVQEENANLTIDIDYNQYKNKFYRFGEGGAWNSYKGEFSILVEDMVNQGGYEEETKTSNLYLRGVDDVGNEVIIQKKIPIKAEKISFDVLKWCQNNNKTVEQYGFTVDRSNNELEYNRDGSSSEGFGGGQSTGSGGRWSWTLKLDAAYFSGRSSISITWDMRKTVNERRKGTSRYGAKIVYTDATEDTVGYGDQVSYPKRTEINEKLTIKRYKTVDHLEIYADRKGRAISRKFGLCYVDRV